MDPQIWTTKEIVMAVIATGVISALVREIVEWAKANAHRERELRYLCVANAVALESFAEECKALAKAMNAQYESYRHIGSIDIPDPPLLPVDCDWRLVDVHLMNQLLSFPNEVRKAQAGASYEHHMESNPWAEVSAIEGLANRADGIAKQLRRNVGLA